MLTNYQDHAQLPRNLWEILRTWIILAGLDEGSVRFLIREDEAFEATAPFAVHLRDLLQTTHSAGSGSESKAYVLIVELGAHYMGSTEQAVVQLHYQNLPQLHLMLSNVSEWMRYRTSSGVTHIALRRMLDARDKMIELCKALEGCSFRAADVTDEMADQCGWKNSATVMTFVGRSLAYPWMPKRNKGRRGFWYQWKPEFLAELGLRAKSVEVVDDEDLIVEFVNGLNGDELAALELMLEEDEALGFLEVNGQLRRITLRSTKLGLNPPEARDLIERAQAARIITELGDGHGHDGKVCRVDEQALRRMAELAKLDITRFDERLATYRGAQTPQQTPSDPGPASVDEPEPQPELAAPVPLDEAPHGLVLRSLAESAADALSAALHEIESALRAAREQRGQLEAEHRLQSIERGDVAGEIAKLQARLTELDDQLAVLETQQQEVREREEGLRARQAQLEAQIAEHALEAKRARARAALVSAGLDGPTIEAMLAVIH